MHQPTLCVGKIPGPGWLVFSFWVVVLGLSEAQGQELLGSARQNPQGSWRATAVWRQVGDQKLSFRESGADVPGNVDGGWAALRLGVQPFDNVEYFIAVGGGHYTLEVASVTVTNRLSGPALGWMAGAGMKVLVVPETPVTPAVSLLAGAERTAVALDTLKQNGVSSGTAQRLSVDRYEAGLWGSKRFERLEPYGGLVWSRARAKLKDLDSGARNGGDHDTVRLVLGLKVPVFPNESLLFETRFAGGWVWQAGWDVRF